MIHTIDYHPSFDNTTFIEHAEVGYAIKYNINTKLLEDCGALIRNTHSTSSSYITFLIKAHSKD